MPVSYTHLDVYKRQGFGYIVLLEEKEGRHRALPVIAATFPTAVIGGTLVQLLIG